MKDKTRFIVIEGLEGAGKTTAMNVVMEFLNNNKIDFITTREPGGTTIAEKIREIVKDKDTTEVISPHTEALLMYAARVQTVQNVVLPALCKQKWVLSDRHNLSSLAYQGGGRLISRFVEELTALTLAEFKPDLTIYLDIEPKVGLERARGRGELDRIEKESLDFFERVRDKYLDYAKKDTTIKTVDASISVDKVALSIIDHLNNTGWFV